jgi:hypothetical protein
MIKIDPAKKIEYNELDDKILSEIQTVLFEVTGQRFAKSIPPTVVNFSLLNAVLINKISEQTIFNLDLNQPDQSSVSRFGLSPEQLETLNEKIDELFKKQTIYDSKNKWIKNKLFITNGYDDDAGTIKIRSLIDNQLAQIRAVFKFELLDEKTNLKNGIVEAQEYAKEYMIKRKNEKLNQKDTKKRPLDSFGSEAQSNTKKPRTDNGPSSSIRNTNTAYSNPSLQQQQISSASLLSSNASNPITTSSLPVPTVETDGFEEIFGPSNDDFVWTLPEDDT